MKDSLDPRIRRADITQDHRPTKQNEHWQTYEVFHQRKRGDQPFHVGIVHASNPEMAMIFAKEQYARRQKTVNIWVVRTTDVYSLRREDEDMFETTPDKAYREAAGYSVREKISNFKKENQ